ncbi:MAG: amino acid permease, partial [Burkholderiales bacterium]|nr:amino acid permease [Burkholderiales bacterium]
MLTNSSLNKIGLISAVFLVTGNMLGSGIYMLPATLAKIGGISIIAWVVVLIGIVAFALVIAKLSLIIPNGAGPYSFAKEAMGKEMGYHTNIIYSIANWVALVSMPTIVVGYLQNIYPLISNMWVSCAIQIVVIWTFTIINIWGIKWIVRMQVVGFAIALIPILTISTVGWFYFDTKIFFSGFNVTGSVPVQVITNSFNSIIWAFIGVESACVVSRLVSNPKRNIPLATVGGVLIAGV